MCEAGAHAVPPVVQGQSEAAGNALLAVITAACTGTSVPDPLLGSGQLTHPGHTQQHRPVVEFPEGQLYFLGLWVNRTPSWVLLDHSQSWGREA